MNKLETFSPIGWIQEAERAGMAPRALVFADGIRQLGTLEQCRGPRALSDQERQWVVAALIAWGWIVEIPLPYREFPRPTDKFEPAAWIRQALYAGLDPIAWIRDDGSKGLFTSLDNAIVYLQPAPLSGDDLGSMLDELIRMGRWKSI